jgi:hypothetical protein
VQADSGLAPVLSENKATLELLVEQLRRRGIIPFVGAGMSRPIYPEWTAFLLESAGEHGVDRAVRGFLDAGK